MEIVIIQGSQIQEVTSAGIKYQLEDGTSAYIDFEECAQREFARRTTPEALEQFKKSNNRTDADIPAYIERLQQFRMIAFRNSWGEGSKTGNPYIEFLTHPTLLIDFEDAEMYYQIAIIIRRAGYWAHNTT